MKNWPARLTVVCDIEYRRLLRQAANARGMSATGYVRRATSAFIAADLDLPFEAVVALTPKPTPPEGAMKGMPADQHPLRNPGKWRDDGLGHGVWQVCADA
jgi:hypothetical protein